MKLFATAMLVITAFFFCSVTFSQENDVPILRQLDIQPEVLEAQPGDEAGSVDDVEPMPCGDHGQLIDGSCDCEPGYGGDNCELRMSKNRKNIEPSQLENLELDNSQLDTGDMTVSQCAIEKRRCEIRARKQEKNINDLTSYVSQLEDQVTKLRKELRKATEPGCIDRRFLRKPDGSLIDCHDTGYNCMEERCAIACNTSDWCAPHFACLTTPAPGRCIRAISE